MYSSPRWQWLIIADQVALRAAGDEQRRLLAEHRGDPLLQRVDGRVVAEDVVADLGARPSPRASPAVGPRHRVAAQVDDAVHARRLQEVLQHRVAVLGEDRLRVELHAFERRLVPASSRWRTPMISPSLAVDVTSSSRRQRLALDRQRVVADHR